MSLEIVVMILTLDAIFESMVRSRIEGHLPHRSRLEPLRLQVFCDGQLILGKECVQECGPGRVGQPSGDDRVPGRRADGSVRIGSTEEHSFCSQPINSRGSDDGIAVDPGRVGRMVVRHEHENVANRRIAGFLTPCIPGTAAQQKCAE